MVEDMKNIYIGSKCKLQITKQKKLNFNDT